MFMLGLNSTTTDPEITLNHPNYISYQVGRVHGNGVGIWYDIGTYISDLRILPRCTILHPFYSIDGYGSHRFIFFPTITSQFKAAELFVLIKVGYAYLDGEDLQNLPDEILLHICKVSSKSPERLTPLEIQTTFQRLRPFIEYVRDRPRIRI
jgi:hypothetical protein